MELNVQNVKKVIEPLLTKNDEISWSDFVTFESDGIAKKILFVRYNAEEVLTSPNKYWIGDIIWILKLRLQDPKLIVSSPSYCFPVTLATGEIIYMVLWEKGVENDPSFIPVIFHELGHTFLGHMDIKETYGGMFLKIPKSGEIAADKFSEKITKQKINLQRMMRNHLKRCIQVMNVKGMRKMLTSILMWILTSKLVLKILRT